MPKILVYRIRDYPLNAELAKKQDDPLAVEVSDATWQFLTIAQARAEAAQSVLERLHEKVREQFNEAWSIGKGSG